MARELNATTFKQEIMTGNAPAMIDFYADWCGPCRAMAPTVDQLAIDYAGKVKVGKVNVDESPDIAREFQVMSVPTFAFIKNGAVVDTVVGAIGRGELERCLENLIDA